MPEKKLNQAQISSVLELYNTGESIISTGKKCGISKELVRKLLVDNNVQIRPPHRYGKTKNANIITMCIDCNKKASIAKNRCSMCYQRNIRSHKSLCHPERRIYANNLCHKCWHERKDNMPTVMCGRCGNPQCFKSETSGSYRCLKCRWETKNA